MNSLKRLTSLQHPLVKHLVKLRDDRRYRWECGSVPVHGEIVVRELVGRVHFKTVFVREGVAPPEGVPKDATFQVTPQILRKVAGVKEPQPLVAEVVLPEAGDLQDKDYWLVLDRLQDPGNMGSLLRTALALGWEGAFIVEGSVDPFNAKALQASKGAPFRLPLRFGEWEELEQLLKNRPDIVVGDLHGTPLSERKGGSCVLILSHEAKGVSDEAKRWGENITIPMKGDMESLNVAVAGAIMMYQLGKNG